MKILVYGANGYTGRLIVNELKSSSFETIVAGRSLVKLEAHFNDTHEMRCFELTDDFNEQLKDIDLVVHCAGPFSKTALPMAEACLATHTHYIDITGEIAVFEALKKLDHRAKEQGIVIMPGAGFDVVPTDCLSLALKKALPKARRLELAFYPIGGKASPGTTKTILESAGMDVNYRIDGAINSERSGLERRSHTIDGKVLHSAGISWGDVSTAYTTTGIPNIRVFVGMNPKTIKIYRKVHLFKWLFQLTPVQKFIKKRIERSIFGPSIDEMKSSKTYVIAKVWDDVSSVEKALVTPNGYDLTRKTAVEIARRIIDGKAPAGYQTPALAFGSEFILQFEGVQEMSLD